MIWHLLINEIRIHTLLCYPWDGHSDIRNSKLFIIPSQQMGGYQDNGGTDYDKYQKLITENCEDYGIMVCKDRGIAVDG